MNLYNFNVLSVYVSMPLWGGLLYAFKAVLARLSGGRSTQSG